MQQSPSEDISILSVAIAPSVPSIASQQQATASSPSITTDERRSTTTDSPPVVVVGANAVQAGQQQIGGGIVYSRPYHYQKRSVVTGTARPAPPNRLFKRTQSDQQLRQRPIFAALPMPSSSSVPVQERRNLPPLQLVKSSSGISSAVTGTTAAAAPIAGIATTTTAATSQTDSPSGQMRKSQSIVDLGARMKDLGQSVKNAAEDELRYELMRFAARTTAHGIPMAAQARKWYAKWMWICISLLSVAIFVWSVFGVFDKFQKKEKIVSVQLRFDDNPFPAITVCNLNPFKKDQARRVPEISETLDAYHQAVTYSKHADQYYDETSASRERRNARGGHRYVQIEPVMSDCECLEGFSGSGIHACVQLDSIPKDNISLCICNYDRQDSTIWPCYSKASWHEDWCPHCNDIGYCTLPNTNLSNTVPCICQKNVNYCLIHPERMKRMWEVRGNKIPDEDSPFRADFLTQLKELGYENMTDEVAITTKTREKLVLTMASLHPEQRKSLSYGRSEFIKMCSFNGQQCNIANDFKLHADPAFGNCYTFNADRERPLLSNRAGPSYGLRLLVHINTSDYLPTTQAAGVRIVIHSQDEYPFPDAFGYSAPTNQLSSFGISLRKVNRLPIPHGECLMPWEPPPEGYIYANYKYEPEGCYKSCYQHQIIKRCGCADPRYPQPYEGTKICNSTDLLDRNCLMVESIKFTRAQQCHCKHPCTHDVYTTAFSSARLTSEAFQATQCTGRAVCDEEFDSQSAAMLEIYYEQMSHEVLTESESYLFVNFISDVGGQAGLWLGASILTVVEVAVFIFRILTIVCRRRFRRRGTIDSSESRSFNIDEFVGGTGTGTGSPSKKQSKASSVIMNPKLSKSGREVESGQDDAESTMSSSIQSLNNEEKEEEKKMAKIKESLRELSADSVTALESYDEEDINGYEREGTPDFSASTLTPTSGGCPVIGSEVIADHQNRKKKRKNEKLSLQRKRSAIEEASENNDMDELKNTNKAETNHYEIL